MVDAISNLIRGLEQFLRYIAPGYVALAAVLYAIPNRVPAVDQILGSYLGVAVLAGILLGVVINSIHVALIEDILCLIVHGLHRFPGLRSRLPADLSRVTIRKRFLVLEDARLRRRIQAEETPARRFQRVNDQLAATMTFLYCSSYPLLAVAVYEASEYSTPVNPVLLAAGIGLLILGAICDVRYTQLDLWAYRQSF